ncbi:hypothetical protein I41_05800 [Lacipirellula limnantheis]|uniref:Uncharacterized protein n=1 Tax=Lacipirellula limnantheis TaxID=2528024 RepID=A0A517TST1_9BACT|nr:hypothetical protein I41_05800 [Lacipirellula limnantheis]
MGKCRSRHSLRKHSNRFYFIRRNQLRTKIARSLRPQACATLGWQTSAGALPRRIPRAVNAARLSAA